MWFEKYNQCYKDQAGEGSDLGGAAGAEGGTSDEGSKQSTHQEGSDEAGDKGDGGKPSDEVAALLKDTMKWKEKAREAQTQIDTLNEQISGLNALKESLGDLDADTIKTLATEKRDAEKAELERKGDYDRIVEQMKEENGREIEKYQSMVTELEQKIEDLNNQLNGRSQEIVEMTLGRSFSESEFIKEKSVLPPSIARTQFLSHFEYEDGKVVGYDKPKSESERTKLVDGTGKPLSFDDALSRIYEKHPDSKHLIRSTQKPGAGSKTDSDVGSKAPEKEVYGIERIRLGLKKSGK